MIGTYIRGLIECLYFVQRIPWYLQEPLAPRYPHGGARMAAVAVLMQVALGS